MTMISRRALLLALLWVVVTGLVAWAYLPGLDGPLVLDDGYNLAPLGSLSDSEDYLLDVVFGNHSGELGRPVAMASFALERLYFDNGVYGQKLVGLLIHLLNGTLVLFLARSLLRAAGQSRASEAAVLIAALWLSLPLLLSTTLYVIQRMTSLSALFSLLALLAYCQAREALNRERRAWPWLGCCVLALALAAFAKENGILAVPMIVALEVFVFGFRAPGRGLSKALVTGHGTVALAGVLGALVVAAVFPEKFFNYTERDYDLGERMLTQTRILWDYVGQIIWPDVNRLGVYQDDYPKSESLLAPGSTAVATLAWLLVIAAVFACAWLQRFRLVAFGIALFLIGHLMESTVIALELYFEHRNYLPAFGLIFALVAAGNQLRERWPFLRGWLELVAGIVLFNNLVLLGSQAVVWSDTRLLHINAVNYHPRSDRALLALADIYARDDHTEAALALLEESNRLVNRDAALAVVLRAFYTCKSGRPLNAAMFDVPAPSSAALHDPYFVQAAESMIGLVTRQYCGRESAELTSDVFREWVQRDGEWLGPSPVLANLLLLDNALERYDLAMLYARQLVAEDPDHVMALQFMLSLSYLVDEPEPRELARQRLVQLRDEGKLTREEVANLELFL